MADRELIFSRAQGDRSLFVWAQTNCVVIQIDDVLLPSEVAEERKVRCIETTWTHERALKVAHEVGPWSNDPAQAGRTFRLKIGAVEFPLTQEEAGAFAGSIYKWLVVHGAASPEPPPGLRRITRG